MKLSVQKITDSLFTEL